MNSLEYGRSCLECGVLEQYILFFGSLIKYWQYFSPAQGRWIHLDSCEAVRDQPLLYSKGWGKRMSFCLAFSTEGAMDVSRGYILPEKWQEALNIRASIISEADLEKVKNTLGRCICDTKIIAGIDIHDKPSKAGLSYRCTRTIKGRRCKDESLVVKFGCS